MSSGNFKQTHLMTSGKIIEALLNNRYICPLEKEVMIWRSQHGFIANKSYLICPLMLLLDWQLMDVAHLGLIKVCDGSFSQVFLGAHQDDMD